MAAAALNQVSLNSMRSMLAAAGIESDGRTSMIKLQGLVIVWTRILDTWFQDSEPGLARTMAALDRELKRGETLTARIDDLDRLASPVRLLGRALMDTRRRMRDRQRQADSHRRRDIDAADPAI